LRGTILGVGQHQVNAWRPERIECVPVDAGGERTAVASFARPAEPGRLSNEQRRSRLSGKSNIRRVPLTPIVAISACRSGSSNNAFAERSSVLPAPLPQLLPRLDELLNRPRRRECSVIQAALAMRVAIKIFHVRSTQKGQPPLQFFQIGLSECFIFGEVWPASHDGGILADSPFVRLIFGRLIIHRISFRRQLP
jgi:hypothetical protein